METTIEKNVPVPVIKGTWKSKLEALEVNDSFEFPLQNRNTLSALVSSHFHKLTEKRFLISYRNEPKGKARVWRLEDEVDNNE